MNSFATYFLDDAVDKQLKIEYDGGTLTNEELHSEEFELTERLCSESQLRFGCCEAATLKFKLSNVVIPLAGKTITVTDVLEQDTSLIYSFGKYKVDSDKPTADRKYRDIVAYDAMHDIISADVAEWYNTVLPNANSTVTLKEFRTSFLAYFSIEQEEVVLVNDSMIVTKTVEPTSLSGKTVITAICEINGCFGHIGRDGKFKYIFLKEMVDGLYPSDTLYPSEDLFPRDSVEFETVSKSHYISATYEDFTTAKINKLQIRQEEDDIGCIYGTGENCYIVQDNFLVYGKSSDELRTIAENMYSVICTVSYRPAHVEAKGNPCLEVGDGIRLATTQEIIRTYILQRTLKGIQALRDTYDAEGEQYQRENVNSVHEDIRQLKGKANILTRTIEETKSIIIDIEKGLSTRITQNANEINLEAQRALEAEGSLSSRITINANSITSEVNRATAAEATLSSKITQTAERIELKVSKGDVSSQLSLESGQVSLRSNRFVLDSTNCSISANGTITAKNVDLTGKITADSGKIGGFTIADNSIYSGKSSFNSSSIGVYVGTDGIAVGYNNAFCVDSSGKLTLGSLSELTISGNIDCRNYNGGIEYMGDLRIMFESGCTRIGGLTACLGEYDGSIGFFGTTIKAKRQSIAKLSTTTSDISRVVTQFNKLLDALNAYNLLYVSGIY